MYYNIFKSKNNQDKNMKEMKKERRTGNRNDGLQWIEYLMKKNSMYFCIAMVNTLFLPRYKIEQEKKCNKEMIKQYKTKQKKTLKHKVEN